MVVENDSHTVKELVEIGMPEECAAILCKLPYDTFVFEINGDKITAVSTFQICEETFSFYGKTDIDRVNILSVKRISKNRVTAFV